jgi:negative regulator of replication initiation
MRTTIRMDDELYRSVREHAARTGRTVGDVIEDAVRRVLHAPREDQPPPPLPTYGAGGVMSGVDLTSNAAVREAMEDEAPLDALR